MMSLYSKIERLKNFIKYFIQKYSPICCFCKVNIDWRVFFPKLCRERDTLTIHHKNHNRENNKPQNLCICHRDCHRRHHREEQLFKETHKKKYTYTLYENFNGKIVSETYKV